MSSRSNSVIVAPYLSQGCSHLPTATAALGGCGGVPQQHNKNQQVNGHGTQKSESGGSITSRFKFLSWNEDETYTILEFLKRFSLPRVVRITNCDDLPHVVKRGLVIASTATTAGAGGGGADSNNNNNGSNVSNGIDITQPILVYKKYRPVRIQGKCLKVQKSGKLKEVGGPGGGSFILPESFPGWFSLLGPDGNECAMTLTSMGQIAAARVPAFLTKFEVPVYKLTESHEPGTKSVYMRSTVRPGSVLRLLGIWTDLGPGQHHQQPQHWNVHNPSGGSMRGQFGPIGPSVASMGMGRASLGGFGGRLVARSLLTHGPTSTSHFYSSPPQFQYIQCLNQENEVLFVPFTATGVFYPIAPRGGRSPQHIYPLSAIARIQRLPIRVKMVFGTIPATLPDFTGTFELENVTNEDVILACTLLNEKPTLFELDPNLGCDLLLSQMASDDLFIKSASYQSALKYCHSEADKWKRAIKPVCPNVLSGSTKKSGGTITAAVLKKSLRLRHPSSSSSAALGFPPFSTSSRLSLLFRPNNGSSSTGGSGSSKDPLRRSKSFNIETQSVSLNLAQDYDDQTMNTRCPIPRTPDIGRKRRSLFNFISNRHQSGFDSRNQQQQPDILYSRSHINCSNNIQRRQSISIDQDDEVPYGRVADEVTVCNAPTKPIDKPMSQIGAGERDDDHDNDSDENIYAEIPEEFALKLNIMSPFHHLPYHNRQRILVGGSDSGVGGSNMSSLIKGGGCGSDGTFSGGTFSSSNPSSTEEEIYDSIF